MAFNWTCPYCNRAQSVSDGKVSEGATHFYLEKQADGNLSVCSNAIGCVNPECRMTTVSVSIYPSRPGPNGRQIVPNSAPILQLRLKPESGGKPLPEFIPIALREDYFEACRIRDLSPKASATLARRCVQGMIRDFCGIVKGTLAAEILALRELVEAGDAPPGVSIESVEAIDHVRGIGAIGAHMEKDINLIIPVEPDEAQILIDLIESLFDDWYIEREKRAQRFGNVKALAESKKKLIGELKQLKLEGPNPQD